MDFRAAQQRVEFAERDAETASRARRSSKQPRDRIPLRDGSGAPGDSAVHRLTELDPPPDAVEHPRERRVAEQPGQSLVIDVSHSCGPSGGGAAVIRCDSGAGFTRMRSAPSHSHRVTSTAATPSIRESCAIASPGTSE